MRHPAGNEGGTAKDFRLDRSISTLWPETSESNLEREIGNYIIGRWIQTINMVDFSYVSTPAERAEMEEIVALSTIKVEYIGDR